MSIGRVGNNQMTRNILQNIQSQLTLQEKLFQQVSSSKKILKPSDDPIGTSESMGLRNQITRYEQYEDVIDSGDVWTNISSTALDSATNTWKRVNELAISAADGTKSANDLLGMAEELEQLLQLMVQVSNTQNAGVFIFGGSKTEQPPFRAETDAGTGRIQGVFYEGDSATRRVASNDNGSTSLNVLGSNAGDPNATGTFIDTNRGVDLFKTMIDLRDQLLVNDTIGLSGDSGAIEEIENAANGLMIAQVRLGGTQQVLQLDRKEMIEQNANVTTFLSQVEDADIASVILELNNVQNVYEAALAAGGRILQKGLINFI